MSGNEVRYDITEHEKIASNAKSEKSSLKSGFRKEMYGLGDDKDHGNDSDTAKEVEKQLSFKPGLESRLTTFQNKLEQYRNRLSDNNTTEAYQTILGEAEEAIHNHAQEIENDLQAASNTIEWIRKQNKIKP